MKQLLEFSKSAECKVDHRDVTHTLGMGSEHAEVKWMGKFICKNPAQLKEVKLNIFKNYTGLEKIKVEFVAHSHQSGAVLTPKKPVIHLK